MKEIYRVLAGAMAEEQQLSTVSNNLANASTAGFKKDGTVFTDFLRQQVADQAKASGQAAPAVNPATPAWPVVGGSFVDQTHGTMMNTNRQLDAAIDGDGFFQVQVAGESQPLYTRAGNFALSSSGQLQTTDGKPVLSDGGQPITIDPTQASKLQISQDGELRAGTTSFGKLGIVTFNNPAQMQKYGAGLMRAAPGDAAQPVATPVVHQGVLEGSNVNPIDEMVKMIQLERSYQASQKAVQTIDEAMQKRIQSIG